MDLREASYFLAIADEGYLTKAAEKLHVTQPTLSHFLSKLEKELGAMLFYRRSMSRLELTPAGHIYYEGAQQIADIWQSTLQSIAECQTGELSTIRCGTSGSAKFTQTLIDCQSRLQERYPGLRIKTISSKVSEIQQGLLKGTLDIGYSAYLPTENRLTYIPLEVSEVDLVVPPQHPLSVYAYTRPGNAVKRYPLSIAGSQPFAIIYEDSMLRAVEEEYFRQNSFTPNISSIYSYPSTLKDYMMQGGFAGFCPRYQHYEGMERIALIPPMYYTLGVYYRSATVLREPVKYLIELLKEVPLDYDL